MLYHEGQSCAELSQRIGNATNNVAEYLALVYGLQEAVLLGFRQIVVYTDSELLANQVMGEYRVKHPTLRVLWDLVQHLRRGFDQFDIHHIERSKNSVADRLANDALADGQPGARSSSSQSDRETSSQVTFKFD